MSRENIFTRKTQTQVKPKPKWSKTDQPTNKPSHLKIKFEIGPQPLKTFCTAFFSGKREEGQEEWEEDEDEDASAKSQLHCQMSKEITRADIWYSQDHFINFVLFPGLIHLET